MLAVWFWVVTGAYKRIIDKGVVSNWEKSKRLHWACSPVWPSEDD